MNKNKKKKTSGTSSSCVLEVREDSPVTCVVFSCHEDVCRIIERIGVKEGKAARQKLENLIQEAMRRWGLYEWQNLSCEITALTTEPNAALQCCLEVEEAVAVLGLRTTKEEEAKREEERDVSGAEGGGGRAGATARVAMGLSTSLVMAQVDHTHTNKKRRTPPLYRGQCLVEATRLATEANPGWILAAESTFFALHHRRRCASVDGNEMMAVVVLGACEREGEEGDAGQEQERDHPQHQHPRGNNICVPVRSVRRLVSDCIYFNLVVHHVVTTTLFILGRGGCSQPAAADQNHYNNEKAMAVAAHPRRIVKKCLRRVPLTRRRQLLQSLLASWGVRVRNPKAFLLPEAYCDAMLRDLLVRMGADEEEKAKAKTKQKNVEMEERREENGERESK